MQLLARLQVADFEAEQIVDVHEAKCLCCVDGERPDCRRERADGRGELLRRHVHASQQRRLQARQVCPLAVEADHGVVRAAVRFDILTKAWP